MSLILKSIIIKIDDAKMVDALCLIDFDIWPFFVGNEMIEILDVLLKNAF